MRLLCGFINTTGYAWFVDCQGELYVILKLLQEMASIARTARRLTSLAPKLVTRVGVITGSQRYLHVTPNRFEARVQRPAPDFKGKAVVDGAIKELNLADYRGKYVILLFYPLDFTFVCPTELIAFSDRIAEFHAINTEVIGVSTDSVFSHLGWINTPKKQGGLGECKYPLLSDYKKTIARDYGVLLEEEGVSLRGLFLIDPNGLVRHMTVNDLPVGRSVDEALRVVQAFQFVEKHGEVCPANWKPDSPTIKPTPDGSREYFTQVN